MGQPEGEPTNPQTLKPNLDTPSLVDDVGLDNLSPKEYLRIQEDALNSYLGELRRSGKEFKLDTKTGQISIKGGGGSEEADAYIAEKGITDPLRAAEIRKAFGGDESSYETDPFGSQLLGSVSNAELALKREAEDAAERKKLQGNVRSYYDTEQDKTAEITRQFKDFDNRASLLSDLLDEEQSLGMNADDQNIQNMKAQKDLGMAVNPGGWYTKLPMSSSLSSILGPSLPDYVRPDYRLNSAVGLPGPEGFDDPNYNQYGMPGYAAGTDPNVPERKWPWPPRTK